MRLLVGVLASLTVAAPASAQVEDQPLADEQAQRQWPGMPAEQVQGQWGKGQALPAAMTGAKATIDKVTALVKATPVLRAPRGLEIRPWFRHGLYHGGDSQPGAPLPHVIGFGLHHVYQKDAKSAKEVSIEAQGSIVVSLNTPEDFLFEATVKRPGPGGTPMFTIKRTLRSDNGFAFVEDDCAIFAVRPWYRPVALGAYLDLLIAEKQADYDLIKGAMPDTDEARQGLAGYQKLLNTWRAERKALTAAQAAEPAREWSPLAGCVTQPPASGLTADEQCGRQVVELTKDWFGAKPGRFAVRWLAVCSRQGGDPTAAAQNDPHVHKVRATFAKQLDWKAMAALVER